MKVRLEINMYGEVIDVIQFSAKKASAAAIISFYVDNAWHNDWKIGVFVDGEQIPSEKFKAVRFK